MAVNDEIFKNLAQYGGSTINERVYNFLGSLGYTGTISDRLGQFEEGGRKGWQGLIRAWGQWAPAQLFSQGQQGVWYEPKPIVAGQQVLYQDAAGTTPVTADGDPVGLMLDRSRGLVLGPETADGAGVYVKDTDSDLVIPLGSSVSSGRRYAVSFNVVDKDSGSMPGVHLGGISTEVDFTNLRSDGGDFPFSAVLYAHTDSDDSLTFSGSAARFTIQSLSVRELPGNHATQSTSAARPIYRTDGVLHWLEFDGVDDELAGSGIMQPSDPISMYVAGSTTTTTANAGFFTINPTSTTTGTQRAIGIQDAETLKVDARTRDARVTTPMYEDSVLEGRFSGSGSNNIDAAVNGGSYTTNTGSLEDASGNFVIGSGLTGALVEGRIYSVIAVSEAVSQARRSDSVSYLAKLAGVTL